ncbi:ESCRT-0 subunit protein hse1, partial [Serendipita sp. 399]
MFRGATNPYDEIVVKATDENQTSENWEILLNLCDKVSEEGEQGARNVIAALLKRLTHRNANVQLYSLAVAEALSKNCGIEVHREIASRAFTQGLEKLVTDRTGHDKVKKKALTLIDGWDKEWADDPSLSIMHELHEGLKGKGFRFDQPAEEPPPDDAAIRRREEEELQRVLELSMQDKGGRSWGGGYAPQPSVGGSSSSKDYGTTEAATSSSSRPQAAKPEPQQPTAGGYAASAQRRAVDIVHQAPLGYSASASSSTTASEPSYAATSSRPPASSHTPVTAAVAPTPASQPVPATTASPAPIPDLATATRVRALHNFEPADAGELAFEKGDVIKVIDRTHKDWWKGQLKGRTGIFPVNYVEALPEPTSADLAREAEAEAAVFAQAANIDKLLNLLRGFDINKDNLADDENIQELYRSSMGVRPKIIRLIEKYNQKKVELAMMNDNFVSAKDLFDRMMEESLARHNPNAFDMRRHTSARPPVNGDYRWGGQYPQQP